MVQRRTNKGQIIDFDALSSSSEAGKPAIGNMGTDAKGNKLGKGGKIIMSNEERVRRYYAETSESVTEKASIKGSEDVVVPPSAPVSEPKTAKTAKAEKQSKKQQAVAEPLPAEPDEFDAPDDMEPLGYKEVELPNGDIQMVPYYKEEDAS
jgi:hypothetical protein